ncbi:hemerythrin domain-containing protein [Aliikangiella sp. IMCC44359]|uniref:hemerythrin domain-containing protein n=1 Tax=Aliikangiella sp. IMCC44359 TaxID=3459125 RepID=UPI00403ADCDB
MNITQELVIEHQLILTINQHILVVSLQPNQISNDEYFAVMEQYVSFVDHFIDDYHHVKEEEFLFQALELPGIIGPHLLIAEMLVEHELSRQALQLIKQGIAYKNYDEVIQGVDKYIQVMSGHISKEENILYPLAEKYLNNSIKLRISQFYEDIEKSKQKSLLWKNYVNFSERLILLLREVCTIH